MNKIIFGGAFDPIHNGHLNMARNAKKALNGEVFFVPARISVWKSVSSPVEDKINMIKLALDGEKGFHIDTYEIDSGKDVNYSIDTVKHFVNKYPQDKFYYLIGTDQVNEFHRWKDAEELSELAQVIYFGRPNIKVSSENIEKYRILRIDGEEVNVASQEIRDLKNLNLPKSVLFYICDKHLYFINKISEFIDKKRLSHCISVAKLAYEIALSNKINNPEKAFVAGLLHDLGKGTSIEKQKEIVDSHFKEYSSMPNFAFHQFVGAFYAKEMFGFNDSSIINAIMYHATGNENMDELAKIVYAADKIEPTRDFDSSDLIEAMMNNVDKGFVTVLKANKDYLELTGKNTENLLTSKCFNFYLSK